MMNYDSGKFTSDYYENEPISFTMPETKSWVKFGEAHFSNSRRFNWLQRKLWKYLLGVEILNVEKENKNEIL